MILLYALANRSRETTSFFFIFCQIFVSIDVSMCDLLHNVETVHRLCQFQTTSGFFSDE